MRKSTVGLALGGIGGFNAHDAGVLKAVHDSGLAPDIITCTSGAIYWTWKFLTDPEGIRKEVERQAHEVDGANALFVAMTGDPKIFAPAYQQYWARWLRPFNPFSFSLDEVLDRVFPAQIYEPKRTRADFQMMAHDFINSSTPVVFNAFAIRTGREILFCNPPALDFLGRRDGDTRSHHFLGEQMTTEYREITDRGVEAALWLVLYGFEHHFEGEVVIDGAYHRQLIISELDRCDLVYAVKPQSNVWRGAPPSNSFQVQDFNTEMWFNSSYAAERAGLQTTEDGRRTQIRELTMYRPLGFFNYFVEKTKNYREGYRHAKEIFERDQKIWGPGQSTKRRANVMLHRAEQNRQVDRSSEGEGVRAKCRSSH